MVSLVEHLGSWLPGRRVVPDETKHAGGTIFAMIGPEDRILIKARDELADALKAEGSEQFVYDGHKDKVTAMPYWTLPDAALEDPETACDWARRSLSQAG